MKIVLIGYMGSGKSTVGKSLAALTSKNYKDLDREIELVEGQTIKEIFSKKGAVYFRKKEIEVLKSIINEKSSFVIATGGGTPCFGNTMDYLNSNKEIKTIYLKASIDSLTNRLFNESKQRPLIAHLKNKEDLKEFISKHLFERSYFYNKATLKIETDSLSVEEIAKEIKRKI